MDVQFDYECSVCAGYGDVADDKRLDKNQPRRRSCDACYGTGARLTDTGRELVEFIERHFDIRRRH